MTGCQLKWTMLTQMTRLRSNKSGWSHLKSLPWQWAAVEVHQNIAERFHVITSTLLDTKVSIHTCIPSCACQVFVLAVRYMLPCSVVTVLLCQAVVNQKHLQCDSTFECQIKLPSRHSHHGIKVGRNIKMPSHLYLINHCYMLSHLLPQLAKWNNHTVYKGFHTRDSEAEKWL